MDIRDDDYDRVRSSLPEPPPEHSSEGTLNVDPVYIFTGDQSNHEIFAAPATFGPSASVATREENSSAFSGSSRARNQSEDDDPDLRPMRILPRVNTRKKPTSPAVPLHEKKDLHQHPSNINPKPGVLSAAYKRTADSASSVDREHATTLKIHRRSGHNSAAAKYPPGIGGDIPAVVSEPRPSTSFATRGGNSGASSESSRARNISEDDGPDLRPMRILPRVNTRKKPTPTAVSLHEKKDLHQHPSNMNPKSGVLSAAREQSVFDDEIHLPNNAKGFTKKTEVEHDDMIKRTSQHSISVPECDSAVSSVKSSSPRVQDESKTCNSAAFEETSSDTHVAKKRPNRRAKKRKIKKTSPSNPDVESSTAFTNSNAANSRDSSVDSRKSSDTIELEENSPDEFESRKKCLQSSLNPNLDRRERRVFLDLIRGDVMNMSLLYILLGIFVNYFYKRCYLAVNGDAKEFLKKWKAPYILGLVNQLKAGYKPTKKSAKTLEIMNDPICSQIKSDFTKMMDEFGIEKVDCKKRGRLVDVLIRQYETILQNNIIKHSLRRFIIYMQYKCRDLEISGKIIRQQCRAAWFGDRINVNLQSKTRIKFDANSPAGKIIIEHIEKFKIEKRRWWESVPHLMSIQDELYRANRRSFVIFPQPRDGFKHVQYSASGFYDLAYRFIIIIRKLDGKNRKIIAMERRIDELREEEKNAEKIRKVEIRNRINELEKQIAPSRAKSQKKKFIFSDEWWQPIKAKYSEQKKISDDCDKYWGLFFNLKNKMFKQPKYSFYNMINTDGVSVSFVMKKIQCAEVHAPKVKTLDHFENARIVGIDPGISTPMAMVWKNANGEYTAKCLTKRYKRYRTKEWARNGRKMFHMRDILNLENETREEKKKDEKNEDVKDNDKKNEEKERGKDEKKEKAEKKEREKGVQLTLKRLDPGEWTNYRLKYLTAKQEKYAKHDSLVRANFNKFWHDKKLIKQIVNDFFYNKDENANQLRNNQSKKEQLEIGKAAAERRHRRHNKKFAKYRRAMEKIKKNKSLSRKARNSRMRKVFTDIRKEKNQKAPNHMKPRPKIVARVGDWALKSHTFRLSGQIFPHRKLEVYMNERKNIFYQSVDEWGTSKYCSKCLENDIIFPGVCDKIKRTIYCSNCKTTLNRDENAARNMLLVNIDGGSQLRPSLEENDSSQC